YAERAAREPRFEALAVDPLHREVGRARIGGAVAHVAHDPRGIDVPEERRLSGEATRPCSVRPCEELQGDRGAPGAIDGAIHDAPPADERRALDLEAVADDVALAKGLGREERRRRGRRLRDPRRLREQGAARAAAEIELRVRRVTGGAPYDGH